MEQAGRSVTTWSRFWRRTFLKKASLPLASTACSWKTLFAKPAPSMVISCVGLAFDCRWSPHSWLLRSRKHLLREGRVHFITPGFGQAPRHGLRGAARRLRGRCRMCVARRPAVGASLPFHFVACGNTPCPRRGAEAVSRALQPSPPPNPPGFGQAPRHGLRGAAPLPHPVRTRARCCTSRSSRASRPPLMRSKAARARAAPLRPVCSTWRG